MCTRPIWSSPLRAGVVFAILVDPITPVVLKSNAGMIEAFTRAPSADADRLFYQQVVAHRRQGVEKIEAQLPLLSGKTKQIATRCGLISCQS